MILASTPKTASAPIRQGVYLAAGAGWGRLHEANPVLIEFREIDAEFWAPDGISRVECAKDWLDLLDQDPKMRERTNWGELVGQPQEHIDQARRVLDRLVRICGSSEASDE